MLGILVSVVLLKDRSSSGSVTQSPAPPPRLFRTTGSRVTPQVEWVEVEAKSVLNRVQGMPFRWSINPYRGCEHDCLYCTDGDTRVLMADGTTKPLGDIRVGDEVYGTLRGGRYRHYEKTRVFAHWATRKQAYHISLEDGTQLIASGDHRFLTNRGWKYVIGTEQGSTRRPHLTTGNYLLGVGCSPFAPPADDEYRRGYLCGSIRGDGLLGAYTYRDSKRKSRVYQFRLALVDDEAISRTAVYLLSFLCRRIDFSFRRQRPQPRDYARYGILREPAARQLDASLIGRLSLPGTGPLVSLQGSLMLKARIRAGFCEYTIRIP